jgi:hypothetical protein
MFQKQGGQVMRALPLVLVFSSFVLFPDSLLAGGAGRNRLPTVTVHARIGDANQSHETYRGYYIDLSAVAGRKDFSALADDMRHQIDIVEGSGLTLRVLQFFQKIPIVIDDFACVGDMIQPASGEAKPVREAACYSRHVPDSMKDKHLTALVWGDSGDPSANFDPATRAAVMSTGTVMVRPSTLVDRDRERPVILHELLHAYHDQVLPGGVSNQVALFWFKEATEKHLYPADAYLMTNEKEFFAVTTSVFLFGKDGLIDRAMIKQAQPDYYKYLVWLFECDPDRTSSVPVALAD